ncbi:MAG: TatD family nuclease-associated radical SAM protein, partial [Methermicoccaceae archaeon]
MTRHGSVLYTGKGNLYLNITNQCTNDCEFCIRHYADGLWGYTLILEEEPTLDEILSELKATDLSPYDEVVFTGFGEPLLRLFDVVEITRYLKSKGKRVRIDTNGTVAPLYPNINIPKILKDAGVDAISISLNAEDAPHYEEICHPTIPD